MTWTWDKVEAESTPPEVSVSICLRGDLVADKDRLELELRQAREEDERENRNPIAQQIAGRIQHLEAEISAAEVEFRFRSLGRKQFTDLIAKHPPTAEQQDAVGDEFVLQWDSDTFPPALVAACCVAPEGITLEHATRAHETWSLGQWTKLWKACVTANQGSTDPGPKSVLASVTLQGSAQS